MAARQRAAVLCLLVVLLGVAVVGAHADSGVRTPTADSYVDASQPSVNFGTSAQLRIDGSPVVTAFLRFDLAGVSGTVSSAQLRVFATSAQTAGYTVRSVADSSWSETGITASNAPPAGAILGTSGPITAGTWTSVDVTSAVAGGTASFQLATTNPTAVALSSRTGANPPQLVITTTAPPADQVPANSAAPVISGTAQVGSTLTTTDGTWSGSPTPALSRQWQRCGATCMDIAGETGSSYLLVGADAGQKLQVVVTASNRAGSAAATSQQTATVAQPPPADEVPANSAAPVISGTSTVGSTLTTTDGTWSGSPAPTFSRQWQRCTATCVDIDRATGPSYLLVGADAGATLQVVVTATNRAGFATAASEQTATVVDPPPAAPANSAPPVISGTTRVGSKLTATDGTWSGSPAPTFSRQWQRCSATCVDINGATSSTYLLVSEDSGEELQVVVTGANGAGSSSAVSAQTATITEAPANSAAPAISGTATVGSTLTATDGTWTGEPAPTLSRQWQRCAATCADIAGETGSSYLLVGADAGQKLQVVVTATNSAGSSAATSPQTATIAGPPVNSAQPAISGSATVGSTLTATDGTWSGSPAPTFTRQWQRCGATCADIAGETGSTYLLVDADAGQRLQVVVTATNSAGFASATSARTAVVTAAPTNTVAPAISGTTTVGSTLTASDGTWSGSPTFTRRWQRCGATCADIAGATGTTYVLVAADAGLKLQVVVMATNGAGAASATSAQTATITAAPANTVVPAISGTTTVGSTLTATDGTWSGSPAPTFTRQWQRCGTTCADITGATGTTYLLIAADAGQKLQVVVKATNSAGSATATSAPSATIVGAPVNSALPAISGTAQVGSTLTASDGTWSGSPTFARRWQRCGTTCADVAGATGVTYVLVAADAGQKLQVLVTATNGAGSATATSALTATVTTAGGGGDPTIATAGDIACDPLNSNFKGGAGTSSNCAQRAVSDLIAGKGFSAVLPLGDNQYYCGGLSDYQRSYDLSWGRLLPVTRPVVGNHEYVTSGGTDCDTSGTASGYFSYFGSRAGTIGQGYYSYDVGTWHLIALNSSCTSAGGCGPTTPQGKWLAADLAAHKNACVLAYWHIPLFSSGGRANGNSKSLWTALYNAGADVVLNGHDHIYERFSAQTPAGARDDARGLREFIVGTGGANHTSLATLAGNSEVRNTNTFGILKLTLHPNSYDWQFIPAVGTGTFTDSGTQACH